MNFYIFKVNLKKYKQKWQKGKLMDKFGLCKIKSINQFGFNDLGQRHRLLSDYYTVLGK